MQRPGTSANETDLCGALLRRSEDGADQRSAFVFLIPSAFMRDASVVGFMPNKTAAPFAPNIFPLVSRKACAIFSRS